MVMIFGFLVMGILAYRTSSASTPMPDMAVNEASARVRRRCHRG